MNGSKYLGLPIADAILSKHRDQVCYNFAHSTQLLF